MFGPEDEAFEVVGSEFDPDAVVWVRGVDYMGGWKAARIAAAELREALGKAGVDTSGGTATAQTRADGSGVVRLMWPIETVQAVADLVRSANSLRKAG